MKRLSRYATKAEWQGLLYWSETLGSDFVSAVVDHVRLPLGRAKVAAVLRECVRSYDLARKVRPREKMSRRAERLRANPAGVSTEVIEHFEEDQSKGEKGGGGSANKRKRKKPTTFTGGLSREWQT